MGACCSCHLGTHYGGHEEEESRSSQDGHVLRGDAGARIRLQGSSKYVSMYTQQGKKGVNQDAMTVWERFAGDKEMLYCGVFDGHGPWGHKVSGYMRDNLPAKISKFYRHPNVDGKTTDVLSVDDDGGESRNPLYLSWKTRLIQCFHEMDQQLDRESAVETYCSGTTNVSVIRKAEHLIISNLGDSRAVLCTRDDSGQLIPEQLTVDLKPNLPGEAKRIRSRQGRILAMDEEPSVFRVWMPDEDCPGLAMARAFGDFCLKDYGLISTPQVTYRRLTSRDEFVVLATDGIWDALSNEEVIQTVASAGDRSMAARLLVEKAVRAWRTKFPRSKTDDCAVVCLFFKRAKATTHMKSPSSQVHMSYPDVDSHSFAGSVDALETVLNCKIDTIPEGDEEGDQWVSRPRKRKPTRNLDSVGE